MRYKYKKVYYCDYCNKHSLMPLHNHEQFCTSNIQRQCRVCKEKIDYESIITALKLRYKIVEKMNPYIFGTVSTQIEWLGEMITIKEIDDLANSCPACMLTIIKHIDAKYMTLDFDYNEEMKKWWHDREIEADYQW